MLTKPERGLAAKTIRRQHDGLVLLAIILLPCLGVLLSGGNFEDIFQFPPPLDIPVDYPHFSWMAFALVMITLLVLAVPWFVRRRAFDHGMEFTASEFHAVAMRRFPWWGWFALSWTLAWWLLAWTRWSWFAGLQPYTFFPLWFGFIISVNGLTQRRSGHCLLRTKPARWLALFALSAVFWWIFEWLNRFAHNWHYLGVDDFEPWAYAAHATLCFSTVLPAVAAVAEWLSSHPRWLALISRGPAWTWLAYSGTGPILFWGGCLGLVGTGYWPNLFYPALWVAPLALLLGLALWRGSPIFAVALTRGDWRRALTWMFAALLCGFFWELWNFHSLAHWIYTVPGVDRWHLFEMPAAGYSGYLPFGLECLLVAERILPQPHESTTAD